MLCAIEVHREDLFPGSPANCSRYFIYYANGYVDSPAFLLMVPCVKHRPSGSWTVLFAPWKSVFNEQGNRRSPIKPTATSNVSVSLPKDSDNIC